MAVKKCCIDNCSSCCTRKEDNGVTYHKFPKDVSLCDIWISVTQHKIIDPVAPAYICSRHFRKSDFQIYKDKKYILKSDAIPSIFPWGMSASIETKMEVQIESEINSKDDEKNVSSCSKDSEGENVDAIKKFIEEQEKEILEQTSSPVPQCTESKADVIDKIMEVQMENQHNHDETTEAANGMMDTVMNQSEAEIEKKDINMVLSTSTTDKGSNSMALSIGSKVEAKDFCEDWYAAEIMEVDYEEMEVLVHYETDNKKHDEWISVSSPRLRPEGSGPVKQGSSTEDIVPVTPVKEEPKETKTDDKGKVTYMVGERCLARWRDNRRFMATIQNDLGDDKYEIIFDDGCIWSCTTNRLYKLKPSMKPDLTVDTNQPASPSTPSPDQYGTGPSVSQATPPLPPYHTHLFDPTRDYLGSKSERREKKRKLNIKEIFNIGQKKQKLQKTSKEKTPKKPVEKNPKNINMHMKLKPEIEVKLEVKTENTAADAVASIIGAINDSDIPKTEVEEQLIQLSELELKKEPLTESELIDSEGIKQENNVEDMNNDLKPDLDPVVEEEVRLEKFDKQDEDNHKEVIAMMKEVINKLEDGIYQEQIRSRNSPKPEMKVILPRIKLPPNFDVKGSSPCRDVVEEPNRNVVEPVVMESKPDNMESKPEIIQPKPDGMESKPDIMEFNPDNMEPNSDNMEPNPDTMKSKHNIMDSKRDINDHDIEHNDIESNSDVIIPKPDTIEPTSDVIEQKSVVTECKTEVKEPILEIITVNPDDAEPTADTTSVTEGEITPKVENNTEKDIPKKLSKVKKGKKLRLLQEKKVKKQVERVKSELEEMKRQMEEMRKEMLKTQGLASEQTAMMPESFLLPGEWCCKWVNGQPVGTVSEIECEPKPEHSNCDKPPLPRRSVQVEDKRLPPGWTKHMVRRSYGNSAGKWDVVLISPENKRFHTKNEMRNYIESNPDKGLLAYEFVLMDFGIHHKLARRMGWITQTPDGATDGPTAPLPASLLGSPSPLIKKKKLSLKKKVIREGAKATKQNRPRLTLKMKRPRPTEEYGFEGVPTEMADAPTLDTSTLEDGYVYVGSLKVQVIENLLRCPAEGCFKNFRNNTLLKMHIKHYHRELRKMMGATPKVLDLAYARTKVVRKNADLPRNSNHRTIKVKVPRPSKREEHKLQSIINTELLETLSSPTRENQRIVPRSQDSPKLRQALNKPVKRPKVLLPVRRPDPEQEPDSMNEDGDFDSESGEPSVGPTEALDFETAISTHTVTKPFLEKKRKGDKKRKSFALPVNRPISEEEDWMGMNSDVDTGSSVPGSGTPDSKVDAKAGLVTEPYEDKDANMYAFNESGERIKIVHMKREEIINCHCGVREEDGLMVQCELCLCWQHALCHNIQREADVPDKYTCSICLNPRRGRRSKRFVHDQDRLYEGLLPGARPCETLRRSHELSGNLLRIEDALHALTVNYYVATKKDHPKLYLWAKDWEQLELQYTQARLNSDYSDLNIMISSVDKENLPLQQEDGKDLPLQLPTSPSDEHDRYSQRDNQLGSQALLSGLLSSPSGVSLDLPISTSELERLAKSVEEQECERVAGAVRAPVPEAAIENSVCRARLLKHIQRCHALIDSRLDSIEAQVAELESQDPSFEDDETADYFPRTKQTVQMMMRDLDTMEELDIIT